MSIVQPPQQPSEATKKVASDGEDYSDTAIESANYEVNQLIIHKTIVVTVTMSRFMILKWNFKNIIEQNVRTECEQKFRR